MNYQEKPCHQNDEMASKKAEEIIGLFITMRRKLGCRSKEVAQNLGFTGPQLGVIFKLDEIPFLTLNQLSQCMSLTKSTMSGIVDRLYNQGVIVRDIPKDNRRTIKLSISEEFRRNNNISEMKKIFTRDLLGNSIKELQESEIEKIIDALENLNGLLDSEKDGE